MRFVGENYSTLSQVPQTLGEESTSAPLCSTYAALMQPEGLRANGRACKGCTPVPFVVVE